MIRTYQPGEDAAEYLAYLSAELASFALLRLAAGQVQSTDTFVAPRLTTAERDAMVAPVSGMVIYNTSTNKLNVRVASSWEAVTST